MAPYKIHHYDLKAGWTVVPHPCPPPDKCEDVREHYAKHGFFKFLQLGSEFGVYLWCYSHEDGRHIVTFSGTESIFVDIMAPDLPSALEVLTKVTSIVQTAMLTYLDETIRNLGDLATSRGGPLRPAFSALMREHKGDSDAPGKAGRD